MKSNFLKAVTLTFLSALPIASFSQFTFSVSPGVRVNGADFGYRIGNFVPQLGVDYMSLSGKYELEDAQFNSTTEEFEMVTDTYEYSINGVLPRIGLKYFFLEKDNLKMYGSAGYMMPFFWGRSKDNGANDQVIEDAIKGLTAWGTDLSFGMEYFFSDQFSMSGQFGLRYISFVSENFYDQTTTNPITGDPYSYQVRTKFANNFSPTFSKVGLNFYF